MKRKYSAVSYQLSGTLTAWGRISAMLQKWALVGIAHLIDRR
ncbi:MULTISPECIES: hypothetical protein [Moorena]|nr:MULTISPECIES: hypothetical protein [Moorena]